MLAPRALGFRWTITQSTSDLARSRAEHTWHRGGCVTPDLLAHGVASLEEGILSCDRGVLPDSSACSSNDLETGAAREICGRSPRLARRVPMRPTQATISNRQGVGVSLDSRPTVSPRSLVLQPDANSPDFETFYDRIGAAQLEERYIAENEYAVARIHLVLDWLLPVARRGGRLLDIGCASGYYSVAFARAGGYATGVDISKASVRIAQRRAEAEGVADRCEFLHGDMRSLPIDDRLYDAVVMVEVLEHVREQEDAVAEAIRALRPGGILVLTTPHALDELPPWKRLLHVTRINTRSGWSVGEAARHEQARDRVWHRPCAVLPRRLHVLADPQTRPARRRGRPAPLALHRRAWRACRACSGPDPTMGEACSLAWPRSSDAATCCADAVAGCGRAAGDLAAGQRWRTRNDDGEQADVATARGQACVPAPPARSAALPVTACVMRMRSRRPRETFRRGGSMR